MKTYEETIEYMVNSWYDRYMDGSNDYRPKYEEVKIIAAIYDKDVYNVNEEIVQKIKMQIEVKK